MLASGFSARFPKKSRSSTTVWSSFKYPGNFASILAAKEISFSSISISAYFVNSFIIGKNEYKSNYVEYYNFLNGFQFLLRYKF